MNWVLCQQHKAEARTLLLRHIARDEPWDWARFDRQLSKEVFALGGTSDCPVCFLQTHDRPYALVTVMQQAFSAIWTYTCGHCGKKAATHDTLQPEDWVSNKTPDPAAEDPREGRHFACSIPCRDALTSRRDTILRVHEGRYRPAFTIPLIEVIKEGESDVQG